jgi:hypothetical protein
MPAGRGTVIKSVLLQGEEGERMPFPPTFQVPGNGRIRGCFLLLAGFLLPAALTACRSVEGPEYREPSASSPHGTILVHPATEEGGGGLRSIDGLRAFPPHCSGEAMPAWKYREWRVTPGMHEIEVFAVGSYIKRTIRIREGVRCAFVPEKYVDSESRGANLQMGMYTLQEEPLPGKVQK